MRFQRAAHEIQQVKQEEQGDGAAHRRREDEREQPPPFPGQYRLGDQHHRAQELRPGHAQQQDDALTADQEQREVVDGVAAEPALGLFEEIHEQVLGLSGKFTSPGPALREGLELLTCQRA